MGEGVLWQLKSAKKLSVGGYSQTFRPEPPDGGPSLGTDSNSCPLSDGESTIEHYPSGSVVARVFLTANPSVYTPEHESVAHCWREKKMIQPHPLI